MTCIDADTTYEIDNIMKSHGVKYLEAQIQGNIDAAMSGYLIILTAGDEIVFKICQSCFEAIGYQSFFFGTIGSACKINLTIKMMMSICVAGLAQGLALGKQFGFKIDDMLEIISCTNLSSALIMDKGACMIKGVYQPEMMLKQMQNDLVSVKKMAEELQHSLPILSAVNEKFKECILLGHGQKDVSAIFEAF
ncbi:hypothetical protein O3M35_010918 [Rhynocoris fuscipes]|uniref:Uncharacterized protein n=1 Tax=Rhynocoris fuscipes TaxID=488301 RepID=A0AAW1D6U7_9HEMI